MSLRRQRLLERAGPYATETLGPEELATRSRNGEEARKILAGPCIARNLLATQLCVLAHHLTLAGAEGLEDFAMRPGQHLSVYSERVKLVLGDEYGNADVQYVECAMYDPKSGIRIKAAVPVLSPTEWFSREIFWPRGGIR